VINLSDLFMDEEQYAKCVKAILREMGTPFLITLYVGACVPQSDLEEIFNAELENKLFNNRDVRSDSPDEKYWNLNSLDDEELEDLDDYISDCLPGYLQVWADGIAAVKAMREKKEVPNG